MFLQKLDRAFEMELGPGGQQLCDVVSARNLLAVAAAVIEREEVVKCTCAEKDGLIIGLVVEEPVEPAEPCAVKADAPLYRIQDVFDAGEV